MRKQSDDVRLRRVYLRGIGVILLLVSFLTLEAVRIGTLNSNAYGDHSEPAETTLETGITEVVALAQEEIAEEAQLPVIEEVPEEPQPEEPPVEEPVDEPAPEPETVRAELTQEAELVAVDEPRVITETIVYTEPLAETTVETAPAEPAAQSTVKTEPESPQANTKTEVSTKASGTTAAASEVATTPLADQLVIGGKTIPVFQSADTLIDAGSKAALYSTGKFIYGHRTTDVFGQLESLPLGTQFTLRVDGETKTYRIVYAVLLDHETKTWNAAEGRYMSETDNNMRDLVQAKYGEKTYDLAMMTCSGRSLGGGDATKRYVVFAYRVG